MSHQGKIVIIGAGHVGSHCAMALAWGGVCRQILLVDSNESLAQAQAADVADALSFPPRSTRVRAGSFEDCADADIVVVAIGEPRKPGTTRLDMLDRSIEMLDEMTERLKSVTIGGIVITITNPADIVADYTRRVLNLPASRIFGTGTLLDTARLIRILSEKTGVSRASIEALSLGEHGDSSMIPFSQVRIGGLSMHAYPQLDEAEVLHCTRTAGMDIIEGKKSTEFGIGQALAQLCQCILDDQRRVLPLSVLLEGQYGQRDIHAGVPCLVGRRGIERIIEIPLTTQEKAQFDHSCEVIRSHTARALRNRPSLT